MTLAPVPTLAHGDQWVFQFGYLPLIIAAGAYLVSLPGSTWDGKAKMVGAISVVGTSAALTLALQFTLPYVVWAVVRWWARRTGRAGPPPVGRADGW